MIYAVNWGKSRKGDAIDVGFDEVVLGRCLVAVPKGRGYGGVHDGLN